MTHPSARIRGVASEALAGRRIILGVSGSIAAVKTVELARELIRHGADVQAVMTPAATRILHPDALHFATGHPPVTGLSGAVEHVAAFGVDGDADLFLVAPATANTVAKMALGIDDTALTTYASVALGAGRPVLVAPAMHAPMEENPPTQTHLRTLLDRGVRIVRPLYEEGKAKLATIDDIVLEVQRALGPQTLRDRSVLIISGPGSEAVDDVRVLTNRSSGRMGRALARAAFRRGAEVTLLSSADAEAPAPGVELVAFEGVADVLHWIEANDTRVYDWVLCPAALSDYAPQRVTGKLSSDETERTLPLERLPKVLPGLRKAWPQAFIVGWKLETETATAERTAQERLERYGLDAVVANAAATMGEDRATVRLVTTDGSLPLEGSKDEIATALFDAVPSRATRTVREA